MQENKLKTLFSTMDNSELMDVLAEIKAAGKTGTYEINSKFRKYVTEVSEITCSPDNTVMMLTEISFFKEAAYRWYHDNIDS